MKRYDRKFALLFILLLSPAAAWAASCTVSGTTLAFGTYTGIQATNTSTVATKCPSGDYYTIGLETGTGSGATLTTRKMTGPSGAELSYEIFQNSTHTTNWDTTNVVTISNTGGSTIDTTAYGLVPAGQSPTPGSYTDTMTIQVECSCGIFTSTFSVTSTVMAECSLSANNLAFGTYTGALIAVQSSITVTCTNSTTYNVSLNQGTATGATVTTRKMTGPSSALLNYSIYRTSGIANWGQTIGTDTVSGTGTGSAQTLTVYGSLPAGQYVTPGSYKDTITATVTY